MPEPKIICAYRAINSTGWATVDSFGATRPVTEEEAARYREVPPYEDLAATNAMIRKAVK